MKQYSLKTLPKKMSSREMCLNHLSAILDEFSGRLLVRELAYIGKILNQANSFEEGDAELIAKYASEPMKIDLKVDATSNRNVLLFNRFALKLIDELLRITFPKTSVSPLYKSSPPNPYVWHKGILVRANKIGRGPIPLTSDFDMDVKKYLQNLSSYQDYLANLQNRPVIWLDALSAESLFSCLRQGLPVEDTLESLAGVSTSQIPKIIIDKIQQHNFKLSRSPLYAEEIELQAELCRTMFRDSCEIST